MTRGSVRTTMILTGALFFGACAVGAAPDEHVDPDVLPSVEGATDEDAGTTDMKVVAEGTSAALRTRRWRWPGWNRDPGTGTGTTADAGTGTGTGTTSDASTGTGGTGTTTDAGTGTGTGSGTVTDAGTGTGTTTDAGTSTGGGSVGGGSTSSGPKVGTNFWFLANWAENAWKSGVDFATTTDPWNPAFIGDMNEASYAVYRFMDWGGTNNSPIRNWSERTQKTSQANLSGGDYGGRGIAYEWMFDLCNRMHTDCWITVPHLAIESYEANPSNNFFTELAKLAKASLDPTLNLYLEYSNETWNGGFGQGTYCGQRGVSAGYATDSYSAGFKFHVYASVRLYESFLAVYGSEISRVKWVVAGQLGSEWGTQKELEALADSSINPNHRTPAYHAISSYVGMELDGAAANIADGWRTSLANTVANATAQAKLLAGTGMKLIAYEGGAHVTTHADVFAGSPGTYDLYTDWLNQTTPIFAVTAAYANCGGWTASNAWGAKSYTGQPLAQTPKAHAIVDWIRSH